MPKVAAPAPTVKLADAVTPAAAAVTVVVPAIAPATATFNTPFTSVSPEAGENITVPLPTWLNVTIVLGMTKPPASLAVMVNIAGDKLVAGTVVVVDVNVSVEPTICTGSVALTVPAVAVIVAMRVALLAVPEEKVAVALPVASVVTV